jgi:cohesin loading factor subunit SCC2
MVRLLELSVPLMDHPSDGFLTKLEEDLMKLLLEHGTAVGLEFQVFYC